MLFSICPDSVAIPCIKPPTLESRAEMQGDGSSALCVAYPGVSRPPVVCYQKAARWQAARSAHRRLWPSDEDSEGSSLRIRVGPSASESKSQGEGDCNGRTARRGGWADGQADGRIHGHKPKMLVAGKPVDSNLGCQGPRKTKIRRGLRSQGVYNGAQKVLRII